MTSRFVGDQQFQSQQKKQWQDKLAQNNRWLLPVVGMQNEPSHFDGGSPAWAAGSYGYRKPASKGGHVHKGVDIYGKKGAGIVAPVRGVVKSVGDGKVSGKYVKVIGDDGYEYYFAHMDKVHGGLARGQRINAGAFLGTMGTSGNASGTQAHLHFEIRKNGSSVNPNEFLKTGRVQNHVPMSAFSGLDDVAALQAVIDEQMRLSTDWTQGMEPEAPLATPQNVSGYRGASGMGGSPLGNMFSGLSTALAGGARVPMAKVSALDEAAGDTIGSYLEGRDQPQQQVQPTKTMENG